MGCFHPSTPAWYVLRLHHSPACIFLSIVKSPYSYAYSVNQGGQKVQAAFSKWRWQRDRDWEEGDWFRESSLSAKRKSIWQGRATLILTLGLQQGNITLTKLPLILIQLLLRLACNIHCRNSNRTGLSNGVYICSSWYANNSDQSKGFVKLLMDSYHVMLPPSQGVIAGNVAAEEFLHHNDLAVVNGGNTQFLPSIHHSNNFSTPGRAWL